MSASGLGNDSLNVTDFRFYRWDGLDGLVRQAILKGTVEDPILLGVTQALKRGVWVQRPADILYEGHAITRDQARELFPDADLEGPRRDLRGGYLSGNIERDPICRIIWDQWDNATQEQRELTTKDAKHVAQLLDRSRRRYEAAWNESLQRPSREDRPEAG